MAGSGNACKGRLIKNVQELTLAFHRLRRNVVLSMAYYWSKPRSVDNSSNVSLTLPTIQWRCFLRLLTAASQSPPKCGALSGMKSHTIFWLVQKFAMSSAEVFFNRKSNSSMICLAASTKYPWSLHISDGLLRRAMKRRKQAMNASDVKSETNSRCTEFDENETCIIHTNSVENSIRSSLAR